MMSVCDTCAGYLGDCACNQDAPVRFRTAELSDFVWDLNDLVLIEEEVEVGDDNG